MKSDKISEFGRRLLEAFGNTSKGEIASKIGIENSTLTNYLQGRIPDADKLKKISNFTNCSIHWLITGEGSKYFENGNQTENQLEGLDKYLENYKDGDELMVNPSQKMFLGIFEDFIVEIIRDTVPQIVRNEIAIANGERLSKSSTVIAGGQELAPNSKEKILFADETKRNTHKKAG